MRRGHLAPDQGCGRGVSQVAAAGKGDIFIEPNPEAANTTPDDVGVGIGEIKATDWDHVKERNVRPLAG